MKLFISFVLVILSFTAFAQDSTVSKLKTLTDNRQFDAIIEQYATSANLSAEALYYVGYAYFIKQDDNNCLKFMDLAIAKDGKDPKAHYIKGSTLNYMEEYDKAIACFKAAIALDPANADYYSGLGDAYYNLHLYDSALENYHKATKQKGAEERPFLMIPQVYFDLHQEDKALEALYSNVTKLSPESAGYTRSWFNIGQVEGLRGNYDKAEKAFLSVIAADSTDYHAYAKLMQVYYHNKAYEKAAVYRTKLYDAHKQGKLKDNMQDMFCFDQFKWNDKLIQVFERYEEGPQSRIFNKQIFYIVDKDGDVDFSIQTEYSPISIQLGGPKYILCGAKGGAHFNYGIGFNDDAKYDHLKDAVIKILEKKYAPVASTR
ncbi:tetratricopeptide repeat protein [Chitinophaga arvensicola]|uniref:Tetratricopeptide repeat-containing protein n=1 Tax=Chitinophaga arvensicola TaxID=29529 RepID=A0A1I0SDP4_9BACT|nr:tetratricopeptide repeat protein [Chitinophaga arvensicola]SEW56351.1 Tetratricopeptide repeat-containing protein [Chitinophaga arvensicola]